MKEIGAQAGADVYQCVSFWESWIQERIYTRLHVYTREKKNHIFSKHLLSCSYDEQGQEKKGKQKWRYWPWNCV